MHGTVIVNVQVLVEEPIVNGDVVTGLWDHRRRRVLAREVPQGMDSLVSAVHRHEGEGVKDHQKLVYNVHHLDPD